MTARIQHSAPQRPARARRAVPCLLAAVAALVVGACKSGDEKAAAERVAPPTIEVVDGMKYYVGGPVMRQDRYGRIRLGGFRGEVSAPVSRGLLLGFKREGPDGKDFDYRTYIGGRIVSSSTGFLDEDERLWFRERLSYDSKGRVVARQTLEYDDEREIMTSRVEQIDPLDGEVVQVIDSEQPYRPLDDDEDDSFFDEPYEEVAEEGEEKSTN